MTLWRDVVAKSPLKARPNTHLANAYIRAGLFDLAEPHLKQALISEPTNPYSLNSMGVWCVAVGKKEEAAKYFRASIQALPMYEPAIANLKKVEQEIQIQGE